MNPKTNSGSTPNSLLRSTLSNGPPTRRATLLGLVRWCVAHRRRVVVAWVAVAVLTTIVAGSVGRQYATNFSLPGTESQRASDLLTREFKAQSGDVDTIVFHVSRGTIDSPAVRSRDHAAAGAGEQVPARRGRDQSVHPAGSRPGLVRPQDRVRDDQLRQARQPAAEQRRRSRCWTRSTRCTCRVCRSRRAVR